MIALMIGVLAGGGTYLLLQRSLVRATFGVGLLGHAANLLILAAGGTAYRDEPLADRMDATRAADPLPQAFVLTAIVITMAVTVFLLALAVIGHNDDVRHTPDTGEERGK